MNLPGVPGLQARNVTLIPHWSVTWPLKWKDHLTAMGMAAEHQIPRPPLEHLLAVGIVRHQHSWRTGACTGKRARGVELGHLKQADRCCEGTSRQPYARLCHFQPPWLDVARIGKRQAGSSQKRVKQFTPRHIILTKALCFVCTSIGVHTYSRGKLPP